MLLLVDMAQTAAIWAAAVSAIITAATLVIRRVVIPAWRLWQLTVERTAAINAIVQRELANGGGMREQLSSIDRKIDAHIAVSSRRYELLTVALEQHAADSGIHRRDIWTDAYRQEHSSDADHRPARQDDPDGH